MGPIRRDIRELKSGRAPFQSNYGEEEACLCLNAQRSYEVFQKIKELGAEQSVVAVIDPGRSERNSDKIKKLVTTLGKTAFSIRSL